MTDQKGCQDESYNKHWECGRVAMQLPLHKERLQPRTAALERGFLNIAGRSDRMTVIGMLGPFWVAPATVQSESSMN